MKVNVFEGARRIIKLIILIIMLIGIYLSLSTEPHLSLVYEVKNVGDKPKLVNADDCGSNFDDAIERQYSKSSKGHAYEKIMCFRAQKADDGTSLIPYKRDENNIVWSHYQFSDLVQKYTKTIFHKFIVSLEDEKSIDDAYWFKFLEDVFKTLGITLISAFCFWVFCLIVGWIVRGFMGIAMGKDSKD